MASPITPSVLKSFAQQLEAQPTNYSVMQRAVTSNGIYSASENNALGAVYSNVFSDEIETGSVTDQRHSGRCSLFSTLNIIRHQIAKDFKMDDFELSQSYPFFWNKLEKANSFLEQIIASAGKPLDDQTVKHLLMYPQTDGTWWEDSAATIMKYGLVPKSVMPEAKATTNSTELNTLMDRKLRQAALKIREDIANGVSSEKIEAFKSETLAEIYRFLTIAIGTPPTSFDFSYKDKDKKYHRDDNITPLEFLKKYVHSDLANYVSVLNDPTKEFNKTYAFIDGGDVVGGKSTLLLNLEMPALKDLAAKQLKAGEAIWFGCDVQTDVYQGFMALESYDFNGTFGIDLSLTKAQRLQSRDSSVNHAMTLIGMDEVKDTARQWKVENSWGDDAGQKGYYTMSNDWFDKNGYVVVIRKDLLTDEQRQALDKPPVIIPAWDPINSSALSSYQG